MSVWFGHTLVIGKGMSPGQERRIRQMSNQEIRNGFNQMIKAAVAAGDHDAVARMEVAREYFSNPQFKAALQDHLWETRKGA
jgi:hypothetical protein